MDANEGAEGGNNARGSLSLFLRKLNVVRRVQARQGRGVHNREWASVASLLRRCVRNFSAVTLTRLQFLLERRLAFCLFALVCATERYRRLTMLVPG